VLPFVAFENFVLMFNRAKANKSTTHRRYSAIVNIEKKNSQLKAAPGNVFCYIYRTKERKKTQP
jgi:hypothetical protein